MMKMMMGLRDATEASMNEARELNSHSRLQFDPAGCVWATSARALGALKAIHLLLGEVSAGHKSSDNIDGPASTNDLLKQVKKITHVLFTYFKDVDGQKDQTEALARLTEEAGSLMGKFSPNTRKELRSLLAFRTEGKRSDASGPGLRQQRYQNTHTAQQANQAMTPHVMLQPMQVPMMQQVPMIQQTQAQPMMQQMQQPMQMPQHLQQPMHGPQQMQHMTPMSNGIGGQVQPMAQPYPSRNRVVCTYCQKPGHSETGCWTKHPEQLQAMRNAQSQG